MKLIANVPKVGAPSDYIGLPFNDAHGEIIGYVVSCSDSGGEYFDLTIEAPDFNLNIKPTMSLEIKGGEKYNEKG